MMQFLSNLTDANIRDILIKGKRNNAHINGIKGFQRVKLC